MINHPKMNEVIPITNEAFTTLTDAMVHFYEIDSEFREKLRPVMFEVTYEKGKELLTPGEMQNIVWFLLDGIIKETRVNPRTNKKKTIWFWIGLTFIYISPGFFNRAPSQSIITLSTDCRIVFIRYEDWKELNDSLSSAYGLTEEIRGKYEGIRQEHADDLKELSSTARYKKYKAMLKVLFRSVKLKYIAEFMGMTPDTLTRIRKKLGD